MSWIAFLVCVFLALGLSTQLSERAQHMALLIVTGGTIGAVYVSFASRG